MPFTSNVLISGIFGNSAAISVVLIVVGVIIVSVFVVGWIILVRRGGNREWPFR